MDNYTVIPNEQVQQLAERGFELIRQGRPQDADCLWDEWGLRAFFIGGED